MDSTATPKIFTKDNIVQLLKSIRETKKILSEIKTTKEQLLSKKDILLKTLEKTKCAAQTIDQEYSEYKELISYIIDIGYYIKKYKYDSPDINKDEIHTKFSNIKFIDPKICISTIKTHPDIAFIIHIQNANICRHKLDYILNINNAELNMYDNKLHKKKLDDLYKQLSKINEDIEIEKIARYEIYKQIINEIIDGNIVRNVPFYNIRNHTIKTNIISDIKCTKQQIRLNCLKYKEIKKRIIEYTNIMENDIFNIHDKLFNKILSVVSEYFSTEKYTILIASLDKKNNTLTTKLENIDKQIKELSDEFSKLFGRMADILQKINISQIHIWNLAVNEFNKLYIQPQDI
jgi:hypothetical protein